MALKFIDNFLYPITLPAGVAVARAPFDLPEGTYLLTIADSMQSPTQYEVVEAISSAGETWIHRRSAELSWPVGSVIFCSVNAEILQSLTDAAVSHSDQLQEIDSWKIDVNETLDALQQSAGGGGGYKAISQGSLVLSAGVDMLLLPWIDELTTVQADPDIQPGQFLEQIIVATFNYSTLRIHGGGRPIYSPAFKVATGFTVTAAPGMGYVDISCSGLIDAEIRLITRGSDNSNNAHIYLSGVIENLTENYLDA